MAFGKSDLPTHLLKGSSSKPLNMTSKLLISTTSSYSQVEILNGLERLQLQNYMKVLNRETNRQQTIDRRKISVLQDRYKEIRNRQIQLAEQLTKDIRDLDKPLFSPDDKFIKDFEAKSRHPGLVKLLEGKQRQNNSIESIAYLRKGLSYKQSTGSIKSETQNYSRIDKTDRSVKLPKLKDPRPWPITKSNSLDELNLPGDLKKNTKEAPKSAPGSRNVIPDAISSVAAANEFDNQDDSEQLIKINQKKSLLPSISLKSGGIAGITQVNGTDPVQSQEERRPSLPLIGPHLKTSSARKKKKKRSDVDKSTVTKSKECLSDLYKETPEYMTVQERRNQAIRKFKDIMKNEELLYMKNMDTKIKDYIKEVIAFTHPPELSKWNRLNAYVAIMKGFGGFKLGGKLGARKKLGFGRKVGFKFS